jgi:hypothetical protein
VDAQCTMVMHVVGDLQAQAHDIMFTSKEIAVNQQGKGRRRRLSMAGNTCTCKGGADPTRGGGGGLRRSPTNETCRHSAARGNDCVTQDLQVAIWTQPDSQDGS